MTVTLSEWGFDRHALQVRGVQYSCKSMRGLWEWADTPSTLATSDMVSMRLWTAIAKEPCCVGVENRLGVLNRIIEISQCLRLESSERRDAATLLFYLTERDAIKDLKHQSGFVYGRKNQRCPSPK